MLELNISDLLQRSPLLEGRRAPEFAPSYSRDRPSGPAPTSAPSTATAPSGKSAASMAADALVFSLQLESVSFFRSPFKRFKTHIVLPKAMFACSVHRQGKSKESTRTSVLKGSAMSYLKSSTVEKFFCSPATPTVKPGVCPGVTQGQFGICVNQCTSDTDCPNTQKCCSNGCGTVCSNVLTTGSVLCMNFEQRRSYAQKENKNRLFYRVRGSFL